MCSAMNSKRQRKLATKSISVRVRGMQRGAAATDLPLKNAGWTHSIFPSSKAHDAFYCLPSRHLLAARLRPTASNAAREGFARFLFP